MAKPKKGKKKEIPLERRQPQMKIVTSDTCAVCKKQCERGIRYLEKMSQPGAIGNGVPCILTIQNSQSERARK